MSTTEGCLEMSTVMFLPPCPTRQFLVYIHSQLIPTSPTKLGIELSSPNQRCMVLSKVKKGWLMWQWHVARQYHNPSRHHHIWRIHDAGICGLTVWPTQIPLANSKDLDQSIKWFPTWNTYVLEKWCANAETGGVHCGQPRCEPTMPQAPA